MTDNHENTMQTNTQSTEGKDPQKTKNESSLDGAACSSWECFCDESYYHLWRVRKKNERRWDAGFHVQNKGEAEELRDLLNAMELAINESIRRPLGVVPDSAYPFYKTNAKEHPTAEAT